MLVCVWMRARSLSLEFFCLQFSHFIFFFFRYPWYIYNWFFHKVFSNSYSSNRTHVSSELVIKNMTRPLIRALGKHNFFYQLTRTIPVCRSHNVVASYLKENIIFFFFGTTERSRTLNWFGNHEENQFLMKF